MNNKLVILITKEQDGQRLDNFLLKKLKGVPKSRIYRMIRKGEVRINKGRVKPNRCLIINDQLRIPPVKYLINKPVVPPISLTKYLLSKAILFENEDCLVINKPVGLAVHSGSNLQWGLIDVLRSSSIINSNNWSLVHRLDRETSGCIIIAKHREALCDLHRQFKANKIIKYYMAILSGALLENKQITAPLIKNQLLSGERMVKVDLLGKPASTLFYPVQTINNLITLTKVLLETGRTHQIRAHAKHMGYPIIGDEKYGNKQSNRQMGILGNKRLCLHAVQINFCLLNSKKSVTVKAPIPNEMQKLLEILMNKGNDNA